MGDEAKKTDLAVAQRLRRLRQERNLTLAVLADQTGVSAVHLSRLEKGERHPSVGLLFQLARVYGVSLSSLVDEGEGSGFHLLRSSAASTHEGPDGRYTVLSGAHTAMSVIRVQVATGRRTEETRHAGEEWLHVLGGTIVLTISGRDISLAAGDAVQFDSGQPHRVANEAEEEATVLIASTAPTTPTHHPLPR
ncbi:helix-turn-helix domain-containing protein [Streptomyces tubercidicus]|uniref:helix-turn-helix domain-containing protein n=1 Tax=Streptomyces tubercidicus TaxID=47759 RepID=UPI003692B708